MLNIDISPSFHKINTTTMPPTTPFTFLTLRALARLTPHASRTLQAIPTRKFSLNQTFPSVSSFRPFSSSFQRHSKEHKPLYESADPSTQPPKEPRPEPPSYQITFTCDPCSMRSSHRISKQGYHKGSILITCPECKNRHVISDHLNVRISSQCNG